MKSLVHSLSVVIGLIALQPCIAQTSLAQTKITQTTYPVGDQSAAYPLKTQLSPSQIAEFNQMFRFTKFDPKAAIALRAKLQPLAEANDPVASYWLAKTYDWYEFGIGKAEDRPTALKWYRQAADLNYFSAAYLLYQTYRYGFMGVDKDKAASIKWLHKALSLSGGTSKAHILVDFARFSDPKQNNPDESFSDIPKSTANHLAYLKQAHEIDPRDTWVADYYGSSLYDAKRYAEALAAWQNSNNPYTWQKIGEMYEKGEGTSPDIEQALVWYKKMAIEGKEQENDLNPITRYGKREVYRLVCLKKVTPQQAKPLYTPEDYQSEFGRWSNEKCELSLG
jgi:TPR repeat protein